MSSQALLVTGFTLIVIGTVACTAFLPMMPPVALYSTGSALIIAGLAFVFVGARKKAKVKH